MTPPEVLPTWLFICFPIIFVSFWLLITTLLGVFSGWFRLQQLFPCNDDTPLLRLRMQSGMLGKVSIGNALSLSACQSGLRVGIWLIFGPFQRPFQVPWKQIEARAFRRLFFPMVELSLGQPPIGRLTLKASTWEKLRNAAQMSR